MDESRRRFLKRAGQVGLGLGCGFPLLSGLACTARRETAGGESATRQWAMIVDMKKCLRDEVRAACGEACHRVHNVPHIADPKRAIEWIWTEEYEHAFPEQAHAHAAASIKGQPVLVLCNQCNHPPCVKVCPTKATWKRERDGIVMMDMHRCIGCRYCIAACPYGARSFNWSDPRPFLPDGVQSEFPTRGKGVVEKCNFCAERLRDGLEPACVEAARETVGGQDALIFGDLSDPDSNVRQVLRQKYTICRKPGAGTGPNVFYIV